MNDSTPPDSLAIERVASSKPTHLMVQDASRMTHSMWGAKFKRAGSLGLLILSIVLVCGGGLCSFALFLRVLLGDNTYGLYLLLSMGSMCLGAVGIVASLNASEHYKIQANVFARRRTHMVEGDAQPGALQLSVDPQEEGGLTLEGLAATHCP